jgi:hypothetical protein
MFGKRLKTVAIKYFGNLKGLSDATKINYSQLSDYVNERRTPAFEALSVLSSVGINIDWLLTGEGEMMKDVEYSDDLVNSIEDFQQQAMELNNKIDLFLRTKYGGKAAAGRLPKDTEGE